MRDFIAIPISIKPMIPLLAQVGAEASISMWPFAILAICVVFIVVAITVMRVHAFLALILAAILAGILTGMEWVRIHAPDCQWLASFATDAPFFPDDLVARFMAVVKEDKADMACARSNGRMHPVFALWPVALAEDLRRAMVEEDIRKVDVWTSRYRLAVADFPAEPLDPFFNVNRLEDLEVAENLIKDKKADKGLI